MTNEFHDDDLSDLLGGAPAPRPRPIVPEGFTPILERLHTESCRKCAGSGRFVTHSGRDHGACFTCNGTGKLTFKTSRGDRVKAKAQREARQDSKRVENATAFEAEHPAEWEWLKRTAGRWDVALSFMQGITKFGSLTDKQMAVVRNGMLRDAARAERNTARVENAPAVDASKIEAAFAHAIERAQRKGQKGVFKKPLKLRATNAVDVLFTPGSAGSQWEGMLFAKTPEGKKLGHIKGGKFTARFECSPVEQVAVLDCAENPEIAAVAFGKAWSTCAICGLLLTNDESIARGIGPTCAEKFGW